jgi:gas vesicle protein
MQRSGGSQVDDTTSNASSQQRTSAEQSVEQSTGDLNWGSARSDYGDDLAYGGLDQQGLGGKSVDDFETGRRDAGSRGYGRMERFREMRRGRNAAPGLLMLLTGAGIGALVMYLIDPEQGRRRRAVMRDKLISAGNQAADFINSKSRDLSNRAQGTVAEARSSLGIESGEQSQARQQQPTSSQPTPRG